MTGNPLSRLLLGGGAATLLGLAAAAPDDPPRPIAPPPSVEEARQRAKLLHGTIHETLQVVHALYFREDEGLQIPAASLKHVFQGIEKRDGVKLRWLAVDGRAMNLDHNPKDDFEKDAAKALASGKDEYSRSADGLYRYAGPITLQAECLKCHLPNRTSNKPRSAGLLISIPVAKE